MAVNKAGIIYMHIYTYIHIHILLEKDGSRRQKWKKKYPTNYRGGTELKNSKR